MHKKSCRKSDLSSRRISERLLLVYETKFKGLDYQPVL